MISDSYLIRFLIDRTRANDIIWSKGEIGPYTAKVNENTENQVNIELSQVRGQASPPLVFIKFVSLKLKKSGKFDQTIIIEPVIKLFSRKYESESEEELAQLLKTLYSVAVTQIVTRKLKGQEDESITQQEIYRQILNFE